jgi:hypothetical protein
VPYVVVVMRSWRTAHVRLQRICQYVSDMYNSWQHTTTHRCLQHRRGKQSLLPGLEGDFRQQLHLSVTWPRHSSPASYLVEIQCSSPASIHRDVPLRSTECEYRKARGVWPVTLSGPFSTWSSKEGKKERKSASRIAKGVTAEERYSRKPFGRKVRVFGDLAFDDG